ncbi:hypothetical protein [Acetobacterium bakii]|nr:hypothetical protein [Acetobacterium bakii]
MNVLSWCSCIMTGYSLPSTLNINCEPLGDNMISINNMGYTYSP